MIRLLFDEPLSEELCEIVQLLRRRHDEIVRFSQQNEATVLELN